MKRSQLINKIKKEFVCNRCGMCCKQPGYVYVTGSDIERMASYLNMSVDEFINDHCEKDGDYQVLKQRVDESCIFLDSNGCQVNPAKPSQCRSFPMKWRDPEAFDYCEGIKALTTDK